MSEKTAAAAARSTIRALRFHGFGEPGEVLRLEDGPHAALAEHAAHEALAVDRLRDEIAARSPLAGTGRRGRRTTRALGELDGSEAPLEQNT